ncbi:MAG: N-acetyltransferase family protein [Liquorilactobacillus ghanensis]|uniref:GNAT family N-acetyltransferase n=1 Tax=Liquorilactobacillus ghanensis TaxID=399370 RepID=UPI0039E7BD86
MKFELASAGDLSRIVEIYNQAVLTRQSTADLKPATVQQRQPWFAAHQNNRQRPLWIIKNTDTVVGWMSLSDFYGRPAYQRTAEISLYLDQNYQGHGIGKQALTFLADQLTACQVEIVLAFVFSHNKASQHLFRTFGYQRWGHLPEVALLDQRLCDLDILGKDYRRK